jgi:hypothetical protein
MTAVQPHFEVDAKGLAKLLERRGKSFAVTELIQNAWDEDVTRVLASMRPVAGQPLVKLTVVDDSPEGFRDLAHAYTLFAESYKKGDPEKRGRFNVGEKLVLALARDAKIETTKGTVVWDERGRRHLRRKREAGTVFEATLRMTRAEYDDAVQVVRSLLPPEGVETVFNDDELPARVPLVTFTATLASERADAEGYLRPTRRATLIEVHEPLPGETPTLYEMGIPVVATDDRYHVNVMQKVPLNTDRDGVTPSYLRDVRALVLNEMAGRMSVADSAEKWVDDALADDLVTPEAVERTMTLRFGEQRVVYDPSDQEANRIAAAQGYTVIPGNALSKQAWANVRSAGAARPAGQVTPSPKPFHPDGKDLVTIPPEEWTDGMKALVAYAEQFAQATLGRKPRVTLANDPGWGYNAAYGRADGLILNLAGKRALVPETADLDDLLIHEYAHEYGSHLSHEYDRWLSKLGARAIQAVREGRL